MSINSVRFNTLFSVFYKSLKNLVAYITIDHPELRIPKVTFNINL